MPLPAPADPFPSYFTETIPQNSQFYRIHGHAWPGNSFNPSQGKARFSPLYDLSGNIIPTLYAATSADAAIFEAIFRGVKPHTHPKTITTQIVTSQSLTSLETQRDLKVVTLYSQHLLAWNLERKDLIDTDEADYQQTALWAQAIHRAAPEADGLLWVSRRFDTQRCLVLFGDRVQPSDLRQMTITPAVVGSQLFLDIRRLGLQAGITIV